MQRNPPKDLYPWIAIVVEKNYTRASTVNGEVIAVRVNRACIEANPLHIHIHRQNVI